MVFDFKDDCDSCESYDFTVEPRDIGVPSPVYFKCPDFPNCPVCTPFMIRISTPDDMDHFTKYHEHEWHADL